MKHFLVTWLIDVWADTPEEAATEALKIQRDPRSRATIFQLTDQAAGITTEVDLDAENSQNG